jgi:hypothetical protein
VIAPISELSFARNNLARLLYRLTGFPARLACFLLNFSIRALGFIFGFEVGSVDQFPDLILGGALDLFAVAFALDFVPRNGLLLAIAFLREDRFER